MKITSRLTRTLIGAGSALCLLANAGASWAQSANGAPQADQGTRLILLGTGAGPIPRKERSQPANLLIVGGRPYLIDAGNGVARQLALAGLHPSDVRNVFITHHHIDHNADVGALIQFAWLEDAKRPDKSVPPVRFYGPPSTSDVVQAGLQYLSTAERIFRAGSPLPPAAGRFEGRDFATDGVIFKDDRVTVTAAQNSHFMGFSAGMDKSFAYRFDTPGRSVVFCGDTGPSEAVTRLAKGADVLVCEVNDMEAVLAQLQALKLPPPAFAAIRSHMEKQHITPEQIGLMAKEAGVKSVVLTHISPGNDGETDLTRYTDGVRKHFAGPVVLGRDMLEF